jgi:hypothetical protein
MVADCAAQGWAAIIEVTTRTTIVFYEFGIETVRANYRAPPHDG